MNTQDAPTPPTFWQALRYWLQLGFVSFGGPAGQIALMHEDLVVRKRWISEKRFLHALNYCMVLPGPEAQQLATYMGWLMHRTWGGVVAGALFVLPSLCILVGLSWVYMAHGDAPVVVGVLYGIKPAVTAIVLAAAFRIGARTLKHPWLWGIALAAFIALFVAKLPFPLIIAAAALLGYAGGQFAPHQWTAAAAPHASAQASQACVIDDHTPAPAHARWTPARAWRVLLVFLGLWAAAMALLLTRYGWEGTLTQMGWFFTKAALLTFGGAYAVLPYVYQGAVEHFQWLHATQMMDGLALGETTPGPLIMVVAFVGFVGGWNQAIFGADALALAAVVAALVVTFFTFLPSFFFIFLGGPLIESTHGKLAFTAPLAAISAAVVGVIVNLALFFAQHVLWPQGLDGSVDGFAALLGLAAAWALMRRQWGVFPVLLGCGLAGLAWNWVRTGMA